MSIAIVLGIMALCAWLCIRVARMWRSQRRSPVLDGEIDKLNSMLARAERYKPENARSAMKF